MKQWTATFAFLALGTLGADGARAADVVVIIDGIEIGRGMVDVAFCDKGPLDDCKQYAGEQPATAETLGFRFEDVPPGKYAFVGTQDYDSSGDNERNMLGMPKEPFALGNGAGERLFPPPDYDDLAEPVVDGQPNVVRLTLQTVTGTKKKKGVPTLPPEAVPVLTVAPPSVATVPAVPR